MNDKSPVKPDKTLTDEGFEAPSGLHFDLKNPRFVEQNPAIMGVTTKLIPVLPALGAPPARQVFNSGPRAGEICQSLAETKHRCKDLFARVPIDEWLMFLAVQQTGDSPLRN